MPQGSALGLEEGSELPVDEVAARNGSLSSCKFGIVPSLLTGCKLVAGVEVETFSKAAKGFGCCPTGVSPVPNSKTSSLGVLSGTGTCSGNAPCTREPVVFPAHFRLLWSRHGVEVETQAKQNSRSSIFFTSHLSQHQSVQASEVHSAPTPILELQRARGEYLSFFTLSSWFPCLLRLPQERPTVLLM